jgi:hypothetical protein
MSIYMSRKKTTHQDDNHSGLPVDLKAKVVKSCKDCISRHVFEGVRIQRGGPDSLNSKSEWHQPALRRVRPEIQRE